MQTKTFQKASKLILSCFPNRKLEPEIEFELLKDLPDDPFLKAVIDICKNIKELYPDSNLTAIIREKTMTILKTPKLLGLPSGKRWESPSKEFRALVKKLAEEKSA